MNIMPDVNGDTLILREGKALDLKEPVKLSIKGDITAVSSFLEKRRNAVDSFKNNYQPVYNDLAIVIVDKENQTIDLQVSPNDHYGTTVTASLTDSEELKAFHINEAHMFERRDLQKLFRFNKRFFTQLDLFDGINKGLLNLKVESAINSNLGSDNRGNRNTAVDKIVKTDLPAGFFLLIPIFKNQPPAKFWVELCLDSSEGSTRLWLESVELAEKRKALIDEIFARELAFCDGLVIINK